MIILLKDMAAIFIISAFTDTATCKLFPRKCASFGEHSARASFAVHYRTSLPSATLRLNPSTKHLHPFQRRLHPDAFAHSATQQTISMLRILHVRWCTLHIAPCCIYTLYAQYDGCKQCIILHKKILPKVI